MLKDKTLFIVGAGASDDYGLPVGKRLQQQILELLTRFPDHSNGAVGRAENALHHFASEERRSVGELLAKGREIAVALALAPSIDAYIENHQHDADIALLGKLGIAACLLDSEQGCPLFLRPGQGNGSLDHAALSQTWLGQLFQILIEGHTKETMHTMLDDASFVVFNYDRCIQQFLRYAISNYFRVPPSVAEEIVTRCRIYHPYGSLGYGSSKNGSPFGGRDNMGTISAPNLLRVAQDLRTYSEYVEDIEAVKATKAALSSTNTIVYLGFAFHRQNVRLLQKIAPKGATRAIATVYGIPEAAHNVVKNDMVTIQQTAAIRLKPALVSEKCAAFMDNYRLLLSQR